MTDLNRFKIEQYRQCVAEDAFEDALCDMALRTHDAEQRAQRAEAECERLREWINAERSVLNRVHEYLMRLNVHPENQVLGVVRDRLDLPPPEGEPNLDEHPTDVSSMTRREYLESQGETTPPEKPQAPTIEELHEERKRWRPDAPHTPEQTEVDPESGLKQCPFCGSTDIDPHFVLQANTVGETYAPGCELCGATAASAGLWNSRALSAARETVSRVASGQTGDALAALDRILLRGDNAKCGDFQIVRNALTASGVPEGYKLVPMEPTPKMVDATWDHDEDETESHDTRNHRIWSAMIAAAPTDGRE